MAGGFSDPIAVDKGENYSLFPHIDRDCDLFKKILATFPYKDSKPVFLSPYTELVENFHQGFAPLAERILHLGRDLRVLLSLIHI